MDVLIEYNFAAEVEILHFFARLLNLLLSFIVTDDMTASSAFETFQHNQKNM